MQFKIIKKMAVFLSLMFLSTWVAAQGATIGTLAKNVIGSLDPLTKLLTAGAYVGGVTFFIVAVFQFKQHKENPQQFPLSKPMMILAMSSALIFLPSFISSVATTIFGSSGTAGSASGFSPS